MRPPRPDVLQLSVQGLTMRFGGIVAVDNLDFTAQAGTITAVIGPNGAGKTTAFNCVTGFYRPTAGTITVSGGRGALRVDTLPEHRVVTEAGIARTFQNIRLFTGMTVLENLLVAQHRALSRSGLLQLQGLLGMRSFRLAERAAVGKAMGWLSRMGLSERANDVAGTLPYGLQRRLEIARAMCLEPRFLCLDEPAAGLNPLESGVLSEDLMRLASEDGVGILLIEHDMAVVMDVSDQVVVLEYGRKIAAGPPERVRADPTVIAAYLGEAPAQSLSALRSPKAASPCSVAETLESPPLLEIKRLRAGYGPVEVLHDIDLTVREGEIVTLLGANGAGKSTLLRCLFGEPEPRAGQVLFQQASLVGRAPHEIAALRIAHSPEGRRIMPKMTVLENLQIGAHLCKAAHFDADVERVLRLFPRLAERLWQRAGTMSGGEQQMLAIGRALMQRPKLLLLDEPSLGLAPLIVRQIFEAICRINDEEGVTILLVEQNAVQALEVADRGYVLQTGRVVESGSAHDLLASTEIRNAYIGPESEPRNRRSSR
jgi:branched-chain amino acid transport system ATP-binding protein